MLTVSASYSLSGSFVSSAHLDVPVPSACSPWLQVRIRGLLFRLGEGHATCPSENFHTLESHVLRHPFVTTITSNQLRYRATKPKLFTSKTRTGSKQLGLSYTDQCWRHDMTENTHFKSSNTTKRGAFNSAKNHKRQRRKRQSVTAKREKSQTPMFV